MDYGACPRGQNSSRLGLGNLTCLELQGDRLIGAFHQEPNNSMLARLASIAAALRSFLQHAAQACDRRWTLPDKLHLDEFALEAPEDHNRLETDRLGGGCGSD